MTNNCPEPHHDHHDHDEVAHKKHHWVERFKCLAFCMSVHIAYEVFMYLTTNHHH